MGVLKRMVTSVSRRLVASDLKRSASQLLGPTPKKPLFPLGMLSNTVTAAEAGRGADSAHATTTAATQAARRETHFIEPPNVVRRGAFNHDEGREDNAAESVTRRQRRRQQ